MTSPAVIGASLPETPSCDICFLPFNEDQPRCTMAPPSCNCKSILFCWNCRFRLSKCPTCPKPWPLPGQGDDSNKIPEEHPVPNPFDPRSILVFLQQATEQECNFRQQFRMVMLKALQDSRDSDEELNAIASTVLPNDSSEATFQFMLTEDMMDEESWSNVIQVARKIISVLKVKGCRIYSEKKLRLANRLIDLERQIIDSVNLIEPETVLGFQEIIDYQKHHTITHRIALIGAMRQFDRSRQIRRFLERNNLLEQVTDYREIYHEKKALRESEWRKMLSPIDYKLGAYATQVIRFE